MSSTHQNNKHDKNIAMGVLSYIGPLVIISYFTSKDDPFVKFHIKQGLLLLVIEAVIWLLAPILHYLWTLISLVNFGIVILAIIGIMNVIQGKKNKLPLIGNLAEYFRF